MHSSVLEENTNSLLSVENNDLSTYCTPDAGVDIIVLAFLYSYGNGNNIPSGTIGQSCFITNAGEGQNCEALSQAITTCQSNGIKIILSLGGAVGSYSLASDDDATTIATNLWKAYGNSGSTDVQRPFGDVFVNGFDFDLEANKGSEYYPTFIETLRSNFASDAGNTYYITGAPQCPIPEPNVSNSQDHFLILASFRIQSFFFGPRLYPEVFESLANHLPNGNN